MIIVGKSNLNKEHLIKRVEGGINHIEIQLLKDFEEQSIRELTDIIFSIEHLIIESVHTPLGYKTPIRIEHLSSTQFFHIIEKTCDFANQIGEKYNKQIPVVIHIGVDLEELMIFDLSWNLIVERLNYLLNRYHFISFSIENESFISCKDFKFKTGNGFIFQNVELVEILREKLNNKNLNTTFDTCHAFATLKTISVLKNVGLCYPDISIENYFEANEDYCNIIHLADIENGGFYQDDGTPSHGITFLPKRKLLLEALLDYCMEYMPEAKLVIEIHEEDYLNAPNLFKMKDFVSKYISKYYFDEKKI